MDVKIVTIPAKIKPGTGVVRNKPRKNFGDDVRLRLLCGCLVFVVAAFALIVMSRSLPEQQIAESELPQIYPTQVVEELISDHEVFALGPVVIEDVVEADPIHDEVERIDNEVEVVEHEELPYTDAELEMMALVIYQEAGGNACSNTTRRMVGEVVLNRVADSRFPNTIEGVLLQKGQYGSLYWKGLVWPKRSSAAGEKHAVERAYQIAAEVLTSENRILPTDTIFQSEFKQSDQVAAFSDGLYFCRG